MRRNGERSTPRSHALPAAPWTERLCCRITHILFRTQGVASNAGARPERPQQESPGHRPGGGNHKGNPADALKGHDRPQQKVEFNERYVWAVSCNALSGNAVKDFRPSD